MEDWVRLVIFQSITPLEIVAAGGDGLADIGSGRDVSDEEDAGRGVPRRLAVRRPSSRGVAADFKLSMLVAGVNGANDGAKP